MWRPVFLAMVTALTFVLTADYVLDRSNGLVWRALAVFCFMMMQVLIKIYLHHRAEKVKARMMEEIMKDMMGERREV